jgi:hypothetical protein
MIYVIEFDLISPQSNRDAIGNWMRQNFSSARELLPQFWVGEGALAAEQIRSGLVPLLAERDRLVVIKTAREAVVHGFSQDVADWIAESFPDSLTERIP